MWHNSDLAVFPPFPHGVMAAHGSLEPFVLVRIQVRELIRALLAFAGSVFCFVLLWINVKT